MNVRVTAICMLLAASFATAVPALAEAAEDEKIRAMIVTGRNTHNWPVMSESTRKILANTGLFDVDLVMADGDIADFRPDFTEYDVVLILYTGEVWAEQTREDFEAYAREGGGVVVMHNSSTTMRAWPEYNRMAGLGGWEDRDESDGPYVYYSDDGELIRDTSPGRAGSHGDIHEFVVRTRQPEHPIMQGLPEKWRHTPDELYDRLRGPAENLTILATAHSTTETRGSGRHEPVLMTVEYGEGRVFHTTMGHDGRAYEGIGFQITLQRGAQWAATGEVTLAAPDADLLHADSPAPRRDPDDIEPVTAR